MGIVSGGGGGSQPQTLSTSLTTDPNTFVSPAHIFDLVRFRLVRITQTATAITPDGETFGFAAGTLYGQAAPETIATGIVFMPFSVAIVTGGAPNPPPFQFSFELQAVNVPAYQVGLSDRYLSVILGIYSNNTGVIYAGANHPTMTATIVVEYV